MELSNKRLTSLDFFRGATVAAMIIVNDPGNWQMKYYQLSHAVWEGCTATDLIFPFFLFIIGVSISLAFNKAIAKGLSKKTLFIKTIKRTIIIFLLGLFLSFFPEFNFSEFRLMGVLQRIALVYLFSSIIFLYAGKTSQYLWFVGILIGYYIFIMHIPVPGIGVANLDPVNNFSAWFDRLIMDGYLGNNGQGQYDTNGIFSTIPAIASALSGVFVGHLLAHKKMDNQVKLVWMFISGCLLMLIGWIFSFEFPMIKRIWTSSYVLYTSGIGVICFASCIWFFDVLNYQKITKPFVAFGVNALIAYFIASVFGKLSNIPFLELNGVDTSVKELIYNFLTSIFNPYNASFVYAVLNTSIMFIPIWWMYKKKIIIKV